MSIPILTVAIHYEPDVVLARQRTRQIAKALGFDGQDQTRLATAVSELARNAFTYARGGEVFFSIEGAIAPQLLLIRVKDNGPGIAQLKEILEGRYQSQTGMGLGIVAARRLVDQCEITTGPQSGTQIVLKKLLPRRSPLVTVRRSAEIAESLLREERLTSFDEVRQQNQELLRSLTEARERQEELARVNQELEDTNRGVVALYAELDERADHLRRADELKTSFLSNMSHEFRTPLNSILALSQILLERTDGDLTSEQELQISYIRKGAESLLELVNDLLDLAKIEAGKIEVQPVEFTVDGLFGALRGMLRPLLLSEAVRLVFDEPRDLPRLYGDESKVSQILRNFIANALKFTERGEVRVSARLNQAARAVTFAVADTGIGIDPADQERIFEEFTQLDNPVQRKFKGTGLGLPLCRKLAKLLGGTIELESRLGIGATFFLTVPVEYMSRADAAATAEMPEDLPTLDPSKLPILVVEDEQETRLIYEKFMSNSVFQPVGAADLRQARTALREVRPRAIVLDIALRGEDAWKWLAELKSDPETSSLPVLVATNLEDRGKGYALGADDYLVKPVDREALLGALARLTGSELHLQYRQPQAQRRVLVIDDEAVSRYILVKMLEQPDLLVRQAASGTEGLRMAKDTAPSFIFLDLNMPDISGFDLLEQLKDDAATMDIPVAIVTSRVLTEAEHARLSQRTCAVLSKHNLSREKVQELFAASLEFPAAIDVNPAPTGAQL